MFEIIMDMNQRQLGVEQRVDSIESALGNLQVTSFIIMNKFTLYFKWYTRVDMRNHNVRNLLKPFNRQIIHFEFSPTWQNGCLLCSNLAGWCHILSLTYLKCGT